MSAGLSTGADFAAAEYTSWQHRPDVACAWASWLLLVIAGCLKLSPHLGSPCLDLPGASRRHPPLRRQYCSAGTIACLPPELITVQSWREVSKAAICKPDRVSYLCPRDVCISTMWLIIDIFLYGRNNQCLSLLHNCRFGYNRTLPGSSGRSACPRNVCCHLAASHSCTCAGPTLTFRTNSSQSRCAAA